jgi:hypothetical protein
MSGTPGSPAGKAEVLRTGPGVPGTDADVTLTIAEMQRN